MQCCCSRAARRRVSNPGRSWFSSTSIQASQATTTSLGDRPFRVGIVGGGPAGFYTAARLLALPGSDKLNVDLFELLPTPFGLARFGVAPDHPEVKVRAPDSTQYRRELTQQLDQNCEHKFEETARDPRFRFFGNVQIGGRVESSSTTDEHASTATIVPNLSPSPYAIQVPLSALRPHYDAMILTYGASLDRPLGIPGEDTLSNVLSARSFVNWYNGHPYHSALLAPLIDLSKLDHVTVIGQGNVALDVARILLKNPDDLAEFDVPESVLEALRASRVKHVDVVGRRGPLQLAATTKELREMMNLPGVGFETDRDLLRDAMDVAERYPGMDMARMRKRALGLLDKGSKTSMTSADKSWKVEFLRSPTELAPGKSGNEEQEPSPSTLEQLVRTPEKVGSVRYAINELIQEDSSVAHTDPSKLNARSTGRHEVRHTDMVLKSVGYRSIGLPGLPFDSRRGIVRNDSGRVTDEQGNLVSVRQLAPNNGKPAREVEMLTDRSLAPGLSRIGLDSFVRLFDL